LAIDDYSLNDFDIIHYDGGLDFYRNSKQALKWKKKEENSLLLLRK
jgi:hypothetical protein